MGFEVELNALPADCSLLAAVHDNRIDAELLTFVRTYFRLRRRQRRRVEEFIAGSGEYKALVDALEELVVLHPGIEDRHCDLERRFEWLKWLLIECVHDEEEKQFAQETILGELRIFPESKSIQGFPIRWTSHGRAELIHIWLSGLTVADLKSKFDPERMYSDQLYKWGQSKDYEASFQLITEDFDALRKFYREVTELSESVLVIKD